MKIRTWALIALSVAFAACGGDGGNADQADNGEGIGRFAGKQIAPFDASLVAQGQAVFQSKCSACHKVTDQKVVGPGLKGVTARRKPQWVLNMMTNPLEMTQKDPTAQELLATHLTQMANQNVTDDEGMAILNFLRSNDGAK